MVLDVPGRRGMKIPVPDEILPADELGRVHFVGIGGAALSGIARIMAQQGVTVTGSDDHDTPFLPSLREIGVPCHLAYDASTSATPTPSWSPTAARDDNPEVLEAPAPAACGSCRARPGSSR